VDKDEIELGTTLMLIGVTLIGALFLPIFVITYHFEALRILQGLTTSSLVLNIVISTFLWYNVFSGLVIFTAFTYYGLFYALAVSKWLGCIR